MWDYERPVVFCIFVFLYLQKTRIHWFFVFVNIELRESTGFSSLVIDTLRNSNSNLGFHSRISRISARSTVLPWLWDDISKIVRFPPFFFAKNRLGTPSHLWCVFRISVALLPGEISQKQRNPSILTKSTLPLHCIHIWEVWDPVLGQFLNVSSGNSAVWALILGVPQMSNNCTKMLKLNFGGAVAWWKWNFRKNIKIIQYPSKSTKNALLLSTSERFGDPFCDRVWAFPQVTAPYELLF